MILSKRSVSRCYMCQRMQKMQCSTSAIKWDANPAISSLEIQPKPKLPTKLWSKGTINTVFSKVQPEIENPISLFKTIDRDYVHRLCLRSEQQTDSRFVSTLQTRLKDDKEAKLFIKHCYSKMEELRGRSILSFHEKDWDHVKYDTKALELGHTICDFGNVQLVKEVITYLKRSELSFPVNRNRTSAASVYNTIFDFLMKKDEFQFCFPILEELEKHGLVLQSETYIPFMLYYSRHNQLNKALTTIQAIEQKEIPITTAIYEVLLPFVVRAKGEKQKMLIDFILSSSPDNSPMIFQSFVSIAKNAMEVRDAVYLTKECLPSKECMNMLVEKMVKFDSPVLAMQLREVFLLRDQNCETPRSLEALMLLLVKHGIMGSVPSLIIRYEVLQGKFSVDTASYLMVECAKNNQQTQVEHIWRLTTVNDRTTLALISNYMAACSYTQDRYSLDILLPRMSEQLKNSTIEECDKPIKTVLSSYVRVTSLKDTIDITRKYPDLLAFGGYCQLIESIENQKEWSEYIPLIVELLYKNKIKIEPDKLQTSIAKVHYRIFYLSKNIFGIAENSNSNELGDEKWRETKECSDFAKQFIEQYNDLKTITMKNILPEFTIIL